jgi:hypothetical protein
MLYENVVLKRVSHLKQHDFHRPGFLAESDQLIPMPAQAKFCVCTDKENGSIVPIFIPFR